MLFDFLDLASEDQKEEQSFPLSITVAKRF